MFNEATVIVWVKPDSEEERNLAKLAKKSWVHRPRIWLGALFGWTNNVYAFQFNAAMKAYSFANIVAERNAYIDMHITDTSDKSKIEKIVLSTAR